MKKILSVLLLVTILGGGLLSDTAGASYDELPKMRAYSSPIDVVHHFK